jgi:monoamine oxidase
VGIAGLGRLLRATHHLGRLAQGVDPEVPWRSADAARLDGMSFGEWLEAERLGSELEALALAVFRGFTFRPAAQMSLLHFLWWVARAGTAFRTLRGGQELVVRGGIHLLVERLRAEVAPALRTGEPVRVVRQRGGACTVETDGGHHACDRVILTAPSSVLAEIALDPPLDELQGRLCREVPFVAGVKVAAVLDAPAAPRMAIGHPTLPLMWRDDRIAKGVAPSGTASATLERVLRETFSPRPAEGSWSISKDWAAHPYSKGAYAIFAPGQLTTLGPALRQDHGAILFAGSERSSWPNAIEGAIESGEQAAERVP